MATQMLASLDSPRPGGEAGQPAGDPAGRLHDLLLQQLHAGRWPAGHRLPTERALAALHGLSRSTVRRVLQQLRQRGLITQTVGSGTYVTPQAAALLAADPPSPSALAAAGLAVSPAELMAARLVLEPAVMELVVHHATAEDFACMDHCNLRAESAQTLEAFEHWDAALHEAIAAAAHNGFIAQLFRHLGQAREQGEWGLLKRRSATPERRAEYQQEHRALVSALKQRDAETARALCLAHLRHVRRNLLGD
jgi:DNA-binding FadR family transcriptional regulator